MKKILFIFGICLLAFSSCCDHQYVLDGKSSGLWEEYHCIKCADTYRLWLVDDHPVVYKDKDGFYRTFYVSKGSKTETRDKDFRPRDIFNKYWYKNF